MHITKWAYKWSLVMPPKLFTYLPVRAFIWVTANTVMGFMGMLMVTLEWKNTLLYMQAVHYWGIYVMAVGLVLTIVLKPPRRKKDSIAP